MRIPKTFEQTRARLDLDGGIITKKTWERAAYVAAYVRLGGKVARDAEAEKKNIRLFSAEEFAAEGIYGLTTKDTVRGYVQVWLDNNEQTYPEPGGFVDIDALVKRVGEWPGLSDRRTTADRIQAHPVEKIVESLTPEQKVEVAAEILREADPVSIDQIEERAEIAPILPREVVKTVTREVKEHEAAKSWGSKSDEAWLSELEQIIRFRLADRPHLVDRVFSMVDLIKAEYAVDGRVTLLDGKDAR